MNTTAGSEPSSPLPPTLQTQSSKSHSPRTMVAPKKQIKSASAKSSPKSSPRIKSKSKSPKESPVVEPLSPPVLQTYPSFTDAIDTTETTDTATRETRSLKSISDLVLSEYRHSDPGTRIDMNDLVSKTQVTKRRFYEIMNVMECVGVVRKEERDAYYWVGYKNVEKTINSIFETTADLSAKMTSINSLCYQFIAMFAIKHMISINDVREEYDLDSRPARCKRLYDIANILESLGLITKSEKVKSKQMYTWNGPPSN
ncbi:hypothetical protein SAMD00019534_034360 [Acytostelium subglobosum LB1]|uniref:hypothetical protein n=1 Tax=Acytostelium subglobosum LB1 TaxID=1410327 RepID=UPI0006451397|nr:hypothetical protein SAMD00019534_034360 [Acytostelium subglobosum LB1]GAM20261.1 hypothetical protein SAMD00019534_034360 [Acytostelium subglobosum LB1]|eukprot:XP_012759782.1 hypothetical protein SAMD00019534_034360 [Acytostelium subglobosum LB1]